MARFTGTKSAPSTLPETMRKGLPQAEKTGFAIATLLMACAFACATAVFGFYKLMQPVQNANPGIAAYEPPPRTVINYSPAARFTHNQTAAPTDVPSADNITETTGRAIQAEEAASKTVDPPPAIAANPVPTEKPVVKRAVAAPSNSTPARASVHYPSGRFGPYSGYASVH